MEFRNLIITLSLLGMFILPNIMYSANAYTDIPPANKMVQEDFTVYMENIHSKLHTLWQPPDFMEEGHVKVFFKLNRQGKLLSASIIESSGNDLYDESALDALKKASPFGEFPEHTLREHIAVKYSFDTILIEEERMKGYFELAKAHTDEDPLTALRYLDMAIAEVGGEEASSFLYKRRADIKFKLGDTNGAKTDYEKYKLYTEHTNIKRVHLLQHLAETQNSSYIYHYLAFAYEQIGDIKNALISINKAIELSDLNSEGNIKKYKRQLEEMLN